jgi:Protein kinase domain
VKVIRPEFAADPEFRVRFTREVANARNVSGMYTALLVDADTEGPVPWLATAYIAGPPLSDAVRDSGPLPLSSLLPLATGLAKALAAIHAAGVVHRDLKPSNVLLAEDGPRVIDFGISHAVEASTLTQSGAIMGSPGYMSPEQAQGFRVGPASDVFSLGAVLAFAATGTPTFGTGSVHALVYRVVSEPPELDQVPPRLRPLLEACLAKNPGDRPSVADVLADVGSELIRRDWLPATVAGTIARYEPGARLAEIAARDSPARTETPATQSRPRERADQTAAAAAVVAGRRAVASPAAPPGGTGQHRKPGPPAWRRHPRRAAAAAAVAAAVAILGTWLATGTDTFGNHPGGSGLSDGTRASTPPAGGPTSPAAGPTATPTPAPTVRHSPSPTVTPTQPVTPPAPTTPLPTTTSPAPAQSPVTSPAASPAPATASDPLSGTGVTVYSCSNYPVGDASGTPASYEWTNNRPDTVSVWFVASGGFAGGETGSISGNSSAPSTLGIGGVYVVENAAGSCLGAVQIDSASGQVTVSA